MAELSRTISTDNITKGVVAGLIGGSVFGVQMATMDMLPMVAEMVGSSSVVVGFILHMLISAVIGATYAFAAPFLPAGWVASVLGGIAWGIVWWVLGALIIMPLALGMGDMVLQVGDSQLMSLNGHVMFGIIMAGFYTLITRSTNPTS